MVLVDTSSWIHLLRPNGDPIVRDRVERALTEGLACWCPMVRLELWNGAGGEREKRVLRDLERAVPELPIDEHVWTTACDLARKSRTAGFTVPAPDLLMAAWARHHGASLETADRDFDPISRL